MNTLDIILLICFIPGIWASARFADIVTEWISQYITASEQVLKLVAFALILIVVFLVLAALGKMLEGVFRLVMLGWLNKLLGMLFALLKTVLIVGLLIIVFTSVNDTFKFVHESVLNESVLYPPLKKLAFEVFPYLKEILTISK